MRKSHKEELFKVAFRLFILDSFEGVSIPDIEKESGFTRGAIFYYADTKLDLFKQVLEYFVLEKQCIANNVLATDSDSRRVLEEISLRNFIHLYVDAVGAAMDNFRRIVDNPSKDKGTRAYLKMLLQIKELLPDLHKHQIDLMKREQMVWQDVLTHAVELGEVRGDVDIELLASVFVDIFYGRAFRSSLSDGIDTEELRNEMMAVYDLL